MQHLSYIRTANGVRKNILEFLKIKVKMVWANTVKKMPRNRIPWRILEWEPEGTKRKFHKVDIWMK
jgi:hypothetical protein